MTDEVMLGQRGRCRGCRSPLTSGEPRFGCELCPSFCLCFTCGSARTQVLYSVEHYHTLHERSAPVTGSWACASCQTSAENAPVLACLECDYYICRACYRPVGRAEPPSQLVGSCTGPDQITLSWTAPPHGGSPIEAYRVFVRPLQSRAWAGGALVSAQHPAVTVTDLLRNTEFEIKVRAVTACGDGMDSELLVIRTEHLLPSPIRGFAAVARSTPGGDVISAAWEDRGSSSDERLFLLALDDAGSVTYTVPVEQGAPGLILEGILPGSAFTLILVACNAHGVSPHTAHTRVVSAPAPPSQVQAHVGPSGDCIEVAVGMGSLGTAVSHLVYRAVSLPDAVSTQIGELGFDAVVFPGADDSVHSWSGSLETLSGGSIPLDAERMVPGAPIGLEVCASLGDLVSSPWRGIVSTRAAPPQPPADVRQVAAGPDRMVVAVTLPEFSGGRPVSSVVVRAVVAGEQVGETTLSVSRSGPPVVEAVLDGLAPGTVAILSAVASNSVGPSEPQKGDGMTAPDADAFVSSVRAAVPTSTSMSLVLDSEAVESILGSSLAGSDGALVASVFEVDGEGEAGSSGARRVLEIRAGMDQLEVNELSPGTRYGVFVGMPPPPGFEHVALLPASREALAVEVVTALAPPSSARLDEVSESTMRVSWDPVEGTGSASVAGYVVRKTTLAAFDSYDERNDVEVVGSDSTSVELTGLVPGTTYIVCVATVSVVRCDDDNTKKETRVVGEVSEEVSHPTLPGPVLELHAEQVSADAVSLAWVAAPIDAGAVYDGFEIRVDGELVATTSEPRVDVTGRAPSIEMQVEVCASTEHGVSAPSTLVVGTRPAPVPGLEVESVGERSVVLAWAESETHGVEIEDYVAYLCLVGEDGEVDMSFARGMAVGSVERRINLTGLRPGTTYGFRVEAVTKYGESEEGEVVVAQTIASVPGAPSALRVVSTGTHSATLSWQAPPWDGGSPILRYQGVVREVCPGGADAPPEIAFRAEFVGANRLGQTRVSGLEAGCGYAVEIFAVNAIGESGKAVLDSVMHTVCDPPAALWVSNARAESAVVAWEAPPVASPDVIVGFLVNVDGYAEPLRVDGSARSAELDQLRPGGVYAVEVCTVSQAGGVSPPSPPLLVKTEKGVPGRLVLRVDRANAHFPIGHSSVALVWELEHDGGSSLVKFVVSVNEAKTGAPAGTVEFGPGDRYGVVEGGLLEPKTHYEFVIRAENGMGWSEDSNVMSVTTFALHEFAKSRTKTKHRPCDVCEEVLEVGLFKPSYMECTSCGLAVHKRCVSNVVAGCHGFGDRQDSGSGSGGGGVGSSSRRPRSGGEGSGGSGSGSGDDDFVML